MKLAVVSVLGLLALATARPSRKDRNSKGKDEQLTEDLDEFDLIEACEEYAKQHDKDPNGKPDPLRKMCDELRKELEEMFESSTSVPVVNRGMGEGNRKNRRKGKGEGKFEIEDSTAGPYDRRGVSDEPYDRRGVSDDPYDRRGVSDEPYDRRGVSDDPYDRRGVSDEPYDRRKS